MSTKLFWEAICKFLLGVALVGLLVFVPAGTLQYWNGWLLMAVLFVPVFLAGLVLMAKNPSLLEKRLQAKETRVRQDKMVKLNGLMFLAGFAAAGLNYRARRFLLPRGVSLAGAAVFLAGYLLYARVLKENTWLSRTIQVQEGQQLVDTGLYARVRHPMYSATLVLFLAMPVVLGSPAALAVFLAYPFLLAGRIRDEEVLLAAELEGYAQYCQRVKYRLIPFVW